MNYYKVIGFFCLTIFNAYYLSAQGSKLFMGTETMELDSTYITDYSDQLLVKAYGIVKSNVIEHVDDLTGKRVEYKPNENFNTGLGLSYKWFGLDLAFNLVKSNKDNDIFGETKSLDLQSNLYLRDLVIDFNFQSYRGYYGFNPETYKQDFDPLNPQYPIRPDIKSLNIGLSALYIFKHDKFSFRSIFTYNERQIRSAGSALFGPYLGYFRMDADATIVPSELVDSFNPIGDFRGTTFTTLGIRGGYAHTFVIGKSIFFSIAPVLGLGPEIIFSPELAGRSASTDVGLGVNIALRAALGYNSEKFFAGVTAVAQSFGGDDDSQPVLERGVSNVKIFIGKRFNSPRFLHPNDN